LFAASQAGASSINFIELPNNGGIAVSGSAQSSSFSGSSTHQSFVIGDSIACATLSCNLVMSLNFFRPSSGSAVFELKEPGGAVADLAVYRTFTTMFGTGRSFSFYIDPSPLML
jgi:hypothetical protein